MRSRPMSTLRQLNFFCLMMAGIETETSNHCQLLMVLLHNGVFNKYIDKQ